MKKFNKLTENQEVIKLPFDYEPILLNYLNDCYQQLDNNQLLPLYKYNPFNTDYILLDHKHKIFSLFDNGFQEEYVVKMREHIWYNNQSQKLYYQISKKKLDKRLKNLKAEFKISEASDQIRAGIEHFQIQELEWIIKNSAEVKP
jgi:hypothetical protein